MTRNTRGVLLIVVMVVLVGSTGMLQLSGPSTPQIGSTASTGAHESLTHSLANSQIDTTPKPYPESPSNVTQKSALSYVNAFERTFLWNDLITPNTTNINIAIEAVNVSRVDTGFVINLQTTYYEEIDRADLQQGLHANGKYAVAYFINDTTAIRARTSGQYNVNPLQRGGTTLDDLDRPTPAAKGLPARPATLSNSSVLAFVSEYEKNYVWAQKLEKFDDLRYVDVAIERESLATRRDEGYVVNLLVTSGWATGVGERSFEADAVYTVNYFVNESVVVRARGPVGEHGPNPRTNGTVVGS